MLFFLYTSGQKILQTLYLRGKFNTLCLPPLAPLLSSPPPPWAGIPLGGRGTLPSPPSPRLWTLHSRSHPAKHHSSRSHLVHPLSTHGHRDLSFVCLFVQTGCHFTPLLRSPSASGLVTSGRSRHFWLRHPLFSSDATQVALLLPLGRHPTAPSLISWHLTANTPISWHLTAYTTFG
jgi:hypothetical protein